jgi:hypothetical protein
MKQFASIILLGLALAMPAQALSIAGITLPESMQAGSTDLPLNGAGIRTKFMMKIYVGGLYLESKNSKAAEIIAADKPMAIRLHMVSGMITSEKMTEATMEGFENTTGGNTAPLKEYIDDFMAVFQEPIAEGDIFDIIYLPGKGLDINKNGEFKGTVVGGLPFKQAVWGIWLGDKPADKKLKKGMLGK